MELGIGSKSHGSITVIRYILSNFERLYLKRFVSKIELLEYEDENVMGKGDN